MPERVRWDAEQHPTYLARMVHAGWVHRLLSAADGRQMPGPDSGNVSLKCERIIEQLTLLGIRYVREPADSERGAQDVRPLNEVLSWRLATCLDMCVTFCCAALDAGVYPMILTLKRGEREHQQRHAIVLVPVNASWGVGCPARLKGGFTREPFLDDDFRIEDLVTSDPERAQSWLAIDAQQATTPPGGSPGDWAKALAKGAEYLRTWQWDVCVDVGGLRATTMLDDASAPEVRDPSGILLPGYLPLAEGATPLQLLRTRSGVVPFCPRRELNQLRDWACATGGTTEDSNTAGTDLAVALVTGAGGCGKTRLAAELCHNLSTLGWCAGFLPARADLSDADLAEFSKLTTELLIVVDYAEESRQEQLRRLLRALAARRSPTRLVLTSRGADVWWEQFQENMEEDGVRLGAVLPMRLEQRLDDPDVPDVPGLLYRRAAHAFAKAMGSSVPADMPSPEREGRTTLDIVLQAWLTALPKQEDDTKKIDVEKLPPTRDNLYDRVLEVEFGRWREEARDSGLTIISKVHHRRAAAVLTMLAPAPDAEAVDEVLSRLPEWSNEHLLRSRYAELLEETLLRGAGDGGVVLQPDPVAEHLVLQVCRKAPELLDEVLPQDPLTVPGLEDPEADDLVVARALALGEQAERCCGVITRAADLDQERALSLARRVLAARPHLWRAALRVSLARGGPFARALEELVTSGADLPLAEIHEAIPLGHSWLRGLGVAVARRLETLAGDEPAQRAQALNNLANRLSEAGRRDEALETAQQVAGLYQKLAEANEAAYTPDLAMSLSNLAIRLSEAGRRNEALETAQEAVDLRRALAEANEVAYTPDLTMSLNNLATFLAEAGRRDEALEVAQQATGLYQKLAEANADAYTPDLAVSLNNLAGHLAEAGRRDEALQAAQQAKSLYQKLAEANADAYTPDLAMSLNNLAIRLAEAGRWDEALQAAQEAVDLRRALAEANADAYTPDLAGSLNNLANRLAKIDRYDEALQAAQKAVDLYQRLAEVNAAAYTPDLAMSLSNLASRLAEAGRRAEALETAQEAVILRRALAEANADAYTPDLATSLNNLAGRLAEAGRWDEALQVAQEAVDLRRALAEANAAAYISDLVMSLNNLAICLSEAGRHDEVLEVFTTNTEHLSSAARAYLLLARARWRGSEGAEDVVVAAQEANKDDDPRFLGPCRREIAAALREHGLTNEDLPIWAVVIVDESLRQCLETWLNCDSPAEQATYLESEWNSPTPSDCETLDALTDLFIDVPPISVLHQYVTQIKSHGIDEIASLLRSQDLAITLTKEWLAEHRRSRGGQYLRNHPTLLTDSRLADLVPQALKNLTSADEAATLTALLDLARLSDPEIAYAVTNADDAVDALADLLGRGKWRAILAALVLNPSLANHMSLGVLAEVLRAAAAGETGKAEVRLQGARESVSSFHIEQLRLLLSQALLHEDCPSGFSDLLDLLNDSSRASSS
mgnify:CR=1 FL=1